jgi:hypothetical protein
MYVEAECGESRGMGTEAYRETKRLTGMGCRTSAAVKSTSNRPFRRLGAKVLTDRMGLFPEPPRPPQAPDLPILPPLFATLSAPYHSVLPYFLFFFLPLDLCYNKL